MLVAQARGSICTLGSPVARPTMSGALLSRTRHDPDGGVAAGAKPGPSSGWMGLAGEVQNALTALVDEQPNQRQRT